MAPTVYNLRSRRSFRVVEKALRAGSNRFDVALIRFSVLGNRIHLLVEAADRSALSRSIQGLSIRIAKAMNRLMGRKGRVLADRYHSRVLRTPTEVHNVIHYLRDNHRRHEAARRDGVSPATFPAGWVDPMTVESGCEPRTWLLRVGWLRAPTNKS